MTSSLSNFADSAEVTLLDVVDTALEKGVVVQGDATISVADVDLVFLGLRLVLAAVDTLEPDSSPAASPGRREPDATLRSSDATSLRSTSPGFARGDDASPAGLLDPRAECAPERAAPVLPAVEPEGPPLDPARDGPSPSWRGGPEPVEGPGEPAGPLADPERMERGLAKLVLTVVELLRRLLEKQALRRMERGSLTTGQIERMGQTFQRLESKMEELKAVFGLDGEDLNLNLGPLGNLI
jgi:hypothetical protein